MINPHSQSHSQSQAQSQAQDVRKIIAYQGFAGAFSHLACQKYYPEYKGQPCASFEKVFDLVNTKQADLALIPVENSLAGRVSDIYHLLPAGGLFITAEHYLHIRHALLGVKGASLAGVKQAYSHPMALAQVRGFLSKNDIAPIDYADTAGAARFISQQSDTTKTAIGSTLAGELYGLEVLQADIQDKDHNATRFLTLSREMKMPDARDDCITSFIFRVRNIPAALYKALGGFATNGVNMTKLESYMLDGSFTATQFYADVKAHPEDEAFLRAREELEYFCDEFSLIGSYVADKTYR